MPTTANREEGAAAASSLTSDAAASEGVDEVLPFDVLRSGRFVTAGRASAHEPPAAQSEWTERSHLKQAASGPARAATHRVLKGGR
jgi:hypothetical protein